MSFVLVTECSRFFTICVFEQYVFPFIVVLFLCILGIVTSKQ